MPNGPDFINGAGIIALLTFVFVIVIAVAAIGMGAKSNKARLKDQAEKSANVLLAVCVFALAVGGLALTVGTGIVDFLAG